MSELYDTIQALCQARGISGYHMCKELGIQPSVLTDLKMGRQKSLSAKNADKIASYFAVSVGYLLGTQPDPSDAAAPGVRRLSDDEIKFALFGDAEIDDALMQSVREFAAFAKASWEKKEKQEGK